MAPYDIATAAFDFPFTSGEALPVHQPHQAGPDEAAGYWRGPRPDSGEADRAAFV
jgi:hypothetical protein